MIDGIEVSDDMQQIATNEDVPAGDQTPEEN